MKAIVAYIPVLHKGYMEFIQSHKDLKLIFVIDTDLAKKLDPSLEKDIRAIQSGEVARMLSSVFAESYGVYKLSKIDQLAGIEEIYMPDEYVSRAFVNNFAVSQIVHYENVFLRWDRSNATKKDKVLEDSLVSSSDFDKQVMRDCHLESVRSTDWWRRVGACIVKNGNVLLPPVHNEHVPSPNQPYYDGDPRASFHRGENIELGTAMHAELGLIAKAAEIGFSLAGASLYVTTFPCPWCAKAIAYSGILKVYFKEGYSVLDAQSILSANDVEIIRVEI